MPDWRLPGALTAFAKVLSLTHAMTLMRYGLVDPQGTGLHDIWGMSNTNVEGGSASPSSYSSAAAFVALAVHAFTRSAVS